jgi:ribosomal protein S27AE
VPWHPEREGWDLTEWWCPWCGPEVCCLLHTKLQDIEIQGLGPEDLPVGLQRQFRCQRCGYQEFMDPFKEGVP